MTIVAKASLLAIALSIGGGAYAETEQAPAPPGGYPVCSRTVTDECINPDAVPHPAARKAAMHHRATRIAHRTIAKPSPMDAKAEPRS